MTTVPDRAPPSTASYILATFILAACAGYFLGQASSIGLFTSKSKPSSTSSKSKSSWPNSYDVTVHPDSSDEELMTHLKGQSGGTKQVKDSEDDDESEDEDGEEEWDLGQEQGGLKPFEENREECKLVLVVRTDLGMGKGNRPFPPIPTFVESEFPKLDLTTQITGKIAAQCAHATLACYKYFLSHAPSSPLLRRWESTGQAKIAVQVPSEEQIELLQAKAVSLGLCAQVIHDAGRTQIASGSATVLGVGPGPRSVVDGVTGGLKLL